MDHSRRPKTPIVEDVDSILESLYKPKSVPSAPPPPKPASAKRERRSRRLRTVRRRAAVGLAVAGIFILGLFIYRGARYIADNVSVGPSLFSDSTKKQVPFTLYFPTSLPAGYALETESVKQTEEGVIIFTGSNGQGLQFNVSLQAVPENADLDKFYAQFQDLKYADTPYGQAIIATLGNNRIASVIAGKTWVLINSAYLNETEITDLVRSLRKA